MAHPALAYEVLDNGKLRFGTGSEASVNANGNLKQPFYFDAGLSQFFKLTFSNYPLDNAIGVGGDGSNEWNINGSIAENSALAGQVLDVSGFTVTSGSKGYGVIVSTGTVTVGGKTLELKNTYTLGADQSFIKIVTRLTNTSGSTLDNVRLWVGTRDDWVGTSDGPTKKRGNLLNGTFSPISVAATRSAALQITAGLSGVLFYSTSTKAYTTINSCCLFAMAYTQDPATSAIQATNDGSYALFVRMSDLADGASEEFTWYYAAGPVADLNGIIGEVAQAADITVTATAGTGGTIAPGTAQVPSGQTTAFTVTADAGYAIGAVDGCNGTLGNNTYTTGVINAACTVTASFTLNSYPVTATAGQGGTIGPGASVNHGATTGFAVTPDTGYSIASVTGCGGSFNGSTYTTAPITAACSITASFLKTPPAFDPAAPPARELASTGLLTELPPNAAPRAVDFRGQELMVTLMGGQTLFGPGQYNLIWRVVDDRGVESTIQEVLDVWPLVSLGPDVYVGFLQGNSASFRIVLNGAAPQTPFTVTYSVSGHLTGHDLASGSVEFAAGQMEQEVFFALTETAAIGTPAQEVEVELVSAVNVGARHQLTIHLLADNVAPVVLLAGRQGGQLLPVFGRGDGPITIATDIRDPNSADTHNVDWISPSGASVTVVNDALVLQADSLPPGIHRFEAVVTDSGSPALGTHGVLDIVLGEIPTPLPDGATEWADNGLPEHASYNLPQRNVLPEREHDLTQFLIEGDPGLRLSLGPNALQQQRFQAQLASNSIGPDTVDNIGGYFDFAVSDLPTVGHSARVVIPQHAPIPANPVYRKYALLTQRWSTFVESSNDALASAPGAEGSCPPPGSDGFRSGLNPGDWCVQLTLSDGGANDDDGQANGVMVDPGGVGTSPTVIVTTRGKGGGGAFDPLSLLVGAALMLMRCRSRRLLFAAAVVAASATVCAQNPWYGGLQFGPARGEASESDVNARLTAAGYAATATLTDLDRNAWRAYAGYQLSPRFSAQMGYTDLGEVTMQLEGNVTDVEEFLASANELHPRSAQGFEFSLNGRYPLTQRISLAGRGGILRWDSRYRARNADGESSSLQDDGTGVLLGAGVQFAVYRAWSLDLNWTNYRIDGESIAFTGLGVSYRFE